MALRWVFQIALFYAAAWFTAMPATTVFSFPSSDDSGTCASFELAHVHGFHPIHAPVTVGEETETSEETEDAHAIQTASCSGRLALGQPYERASIHGPATVGKLYLIQRNLRI
jgi:hypothetical protein